jgi:DNA-binding winged helix-turn-helix (wHTH) protein
VAITCHHFSFNAERRSVVGAEGTPLHLTPKAFDLLQILIEEAPRVVRKAELHTRLWPDTFVSDAALTSLVKELRRVLRNLDTGAPLIKTTHGVGYAFDHACSFARAAREGIHWLIGPRRRYELKPGANVIGRDATADVRVDGVDVSRRHASIVVADENAAIEDLGSKNGTAVGGTLLVSGFALKDGDCIRVGSVTLTYRRQACDESTVTLVDH